MIEIYSNTKVYIACPANIATGGPELLHQLAYHLSNSLHIKAFMYYYYDSKFYKLKSRLKNEVPVHPAYRNYNIPYVIKIPNEEDDKKNILIVPEGLYGLSFYKNIRKGVWFLSVNNYYIWKYLHELSIKDRIVDFIRKAINKISKFLIKKHLIIFDITSQELFDQLIAKYDFRKDPILKLADFYLLQSNYALHHFKELKPNYYLSDYLNKSFLEFHTDLSKKENIVAFNPSKGFVFTRKIRFSGKDIKFVPLVNMSREEVIKTLQKAKVYIDFGNHPGKDRIPREAAILGCCVITGKRGAAAFFEDVPIPDEYKFDDKEESIPKIIDRIKDCFDNFDERYKDFEYYREFIKNEPNKFVDDLRKFFIKVEK